MCEKEHYAKLICWENEIIYGTTGQPERGYSKLSLPRHKGLFRVSRAYRANLIFQNEKPSSFNKTEVQIDDTVKYLFRVPFESEIISSVSRSNARDLSHASMAGLITP